MTNLNSIRKSNILMSRYLTLVSPLNVVIYRKYFQATAICPIRGSSNIVACDLNTHTLKIINTTNWEVDGTVGTRGSKSNQFEILSSVACLEVGEDIYFITTEIRNQRLQIFNYRSGQNVICTSTGMWPMPGQFHNPMSVACHLPKHFLSDIHSLNAPLVPDWYLGPCDSKDMMLQLEKKSHPGSLVMCQRPYDASAFDVAYMLDNVRIYEDTLRRQANGRVFLSSSAGVTASATSVWDILKQWPTARKVRCRLIRYPKGNLIASVWSGLRPEAVRPGGSRRSRKLQSAGFQIFLDGLRNI